MAAASASMVSAISRWPHHQPRDVGQELAPPHNGGRKHSCELVHIGLDMACNSLHGTPIASRLGASVGSLCDHVSRVRWREP